MLSPQTLALALLVYGALWPLSLRAALWLGARLPSQAPLPDFAHLLLPRAPFARAKRATDLLCYAVPLWAFARAPDADALGRYLCALQALRCACFAFTSLPDASQRAHERAHWARFFLGGVHDLVFSGHVAYAFGPLAHLRAAGALSAREFALGGLLSAACAVICVGSRAHYTVDVVVAFPCCAWLAAALA